MRRVDPSTCVTTSALAAPKDHGDSVALSVSPLHLALPIFEVTAELLLTRSTAVALIGGAGKVSVESTSNGGTSKQSFTVLEAGGPGRYSFYGSSQEGAFAGAELLYVHFSGEADGVTGVGNGFSVGPLIGYKWVWDSGFFIDLNGGVSSVVARASAQDGEDSESGESSEVLPNLNFNLGLSF
jgi:hypothetical protein